MIIVSIFFFKVYQLISRRRFQQMEVLEGQNILVTISGKKNRVRVYYLSWLKSKILRTDGLSDVRIYTHTQTIHYTQYFLLSRQFNLINSKSNDVMDGSMSAIYKAPFILRLSNTNESSF